MANNEHLDILNQGVEIWNKWREDNPQIKPDLSSANLTGFDFVLPKGITENLTFNFPLHIAPNWIDIKGVNLRRANLSRASLAGSHLLLADLCEANLIEANLSGADLRKSNLQRAVLGYTTMRAADRFYASSQKHLEIFIGANLSDAGLSGADMTEAALIGVDFSRADLEEAVLVNSKLFGANLSDALINRANLTECQLQTTKLVGINLSSVLGLDSVRHLAPSTVSMDTIYESEGQIPISFLRGCGLPDSFIEYIESLTEDGRRYYSCFISYSSADEDFAKRLHADLQDNGVRCWFAPEDMKIGDRIRTAIDQSIRNYDKLLIVLSEHSITSQWVEKEVETAFEEEKMRKQPVLFPIRLDRLVFDTDESWAADIRRLCHIGDFSNWKDHDAYSIALTRLLRDLKAAN
jgi:uncharacterized protein YjbI with pentapeptide repeats